MFDCPAKINTRTVLLSVPALKPSVGTNRSIARVRCFIGCLAFYENWVRSDLFWGLIIAPLWLFSGRGKIVDLQALSFWGTLVGAAALSLFPKAGL
jgi:hypothetical protein